MRDRVLDLLPSNVVSFDLDGVLLSRSSSLESFGALNPGVVSFIKFLYASGYEVVVYSARGDFCKVCKFITASDIGKYVSRVTNVKEDAVLFVDDRAYRFNNRGVFDFMRILNVLLYHRGFSFVRRWFCVLSYLLGGNV